MVPMRDGVRLAFDVYRPGSGGAFAAGRFPVIMLHTWSRFLHPVLRLRDSRSGPTCSSSRRSRSPSEVEVTGPMEVHLWISSSAVDTDFTAKLVDVHPANEDYPARLRHAPDRLDHPLPLSRRVRPRGADGRRVRSIPVTIRLQATSNVFDVGHRIRVDISSSNWPRLDVNPNTGEPMGRHTRQVIAEQVVYLDAAHPSRSSCR